MSDDEGHRRIDNYVDTIVSTHAIVERMEKSMTEHVAQDRTDFIAVHEKIGKESNTVHKRVDALAKIVYVGLGGALVLEFVLMFLKKN